MNRRRALRAVAVGATLSEGDRTRHLDEDVTSWRSLGYAQVGADDRLRFETSDC